MKQVGLLFMGVFMCLAFTSTGQSLLSLSDEARKIKAVYDVLDKVPDAPEVHSRYIDVFPSSRDLFMDLFNSPQKDQLDAQSHDYIMALHQSSISYPDRALAKCLSIGTELVAWSAGPVEDLQNITFDIALNNIDTFITTIYQFNKKETGAIAVFLASYKNDTINPQYTKLVALLEQREQWKLIKTFDKALQQ